MLRLSLIQILKLIFVCFACDTHMDMPTARRDKMIQINERRQQEAGKYTI